MKKRFQCQELLDQVITKLITSSLLHFTLTSNLKVKSVICSFVDGPSFPQVAAGCATTPSVPAQAEEV